MRWRDLCYPPLKFSMCLDVVGRSFPRSFKAYKPPLHFVYGILCTTRANKILLVRGRLSRKWSFPKGHRLRGEFAIDCALRELQEETGICLEKPKQYPKSYIFSRNRNSDGPEYFHFEVEEELPITIRDTREITEAGWFTQDDLRQMPGNIDVSKYLQQQELYKIDIRDGSLTDISEK